jgi:HPt (histidine-containing phosphotransfer) domain-containing protein
VCVFDTPCGVHRRSRSGQARPDEHRRAPGLAIVGKRPADLAAMPDARFNAEALIVEFGDEGLIAELAQLLLAHVDEQLAAVHAAVAAGSGTALKSAAHKIKGGMGTFGAQAVTSLAMELEAIGRDGRLDGADVLASRLDAEVRALCEEARLWLEGRAA